jgi:hypothetical protein
MDDLPLDRPAVAVRACAEQLLTDLIASREDPSARGVTLSLGGWRVRVEACPSPPEELVPGLNECGRAALALLWHAGGPLSAEKVRDKLEAEGKIFGLITVKRALRLLHRGHGVVEHSRHRPRGYYLPQRLPLFRVRPRREAGADNQLDT